MSLSLSFRLKFSMKERVLEEQGKALPGVRGTRNVNMEALNEQLFPLGKVGEENGSKHTLLKKVG